MGDQPKKISFGFTKTKSVSSVIVKPPADEKIQYIDCIDNLNIKVIGVDEDEKPKELIIPLLDPRSSLISRKIINTNTKDNTIEKEKIDENGDKEEKMEIEQETLEEQAARELVEDAQNTDKENERTTLVLEIPPSESMFDSNKQSSLDDYEGVPVQCFGLAMLKGMGWKPTDTKKKEETKEIMVRPKGLGLGADLGIKKNPLVNNKDDNGEELKMMKNAYVQIIMGKDQGKYGQVEGFDDDFDRIFVKLALERTSASINGSLIRLVSKKEYDLKSKVLNIRQYDDFVKNGDKKTTNQLMPDNEEGEEEEEKEDNRKRKKSHKHQHKKKDKKRTRSVSRSRSRSRSKSREREKMRKHKKKEHKESRSRSRERERRRDKHRKRN